MAAGAGGAGAVVECGSDVHPLVQAGGVGAATDPVTGEPGGTGQDLPRRDQHPCSSQGSRCSSNEETAEQRDEREALSRFRGGFGTKACVITDAIGPAVAFMLAPGEDHELPHAIPMLQKLPVCRSGRLPIGPTAATPFATTSGTWAHAR